MELRLIETTDRKFKVQIKKIDKFVDLFKSDCLIAAQVQYDSLSKMRGLLLEDNFKAIVYKKG